MSLHKLVRRPQFRFLAAAAGALLLAGVFTGVVLAGRSTYVLEVNGRALGMVHGKSLVKQALNDLATELTGELGRPVHVGRQVSLVRYLNPKGQDQAQQAMADGQGAPVAEVQTGVSAQGTDSQSGPQAEARGATIPAALPELADARAVREALRNVSPFVVGGFMIRIEGRDVVGLLKEDEVQAVVDELKAEEAWRIQQRGASVASLEFEQKVVVEAADVSLDRLRTKDEAKRILTRGTDKVETYVVSRGDTLWTIASRHGTTVDSLLKANPEVPKSGNIVPGQTLSLIEANPYLSIISVEIKTVKEWIPFPIQVVEDPALWPWQNVVKQAGTGGQKEVTYRIERRTSDRQQKTIVLAEKVLSQPNLQIEVRGTKRAPALGTGTLYWPLATGQITSGFGWRWSGLHTGVDIAAPRGTEVDAADAGTIVYLGSKGRYGRTIMLDHGGGHVVTLYGHLNAYAAGLREGSTVEKGQVIGFVGSSGNSTGPHLHFEVRLDNKTVNPLGFYPK
ncbi:MAG TPA: peptidoglycan DD-metalloendopeptidase family protein [Bacillota bacterium]|jgi:murein DD-endopeptidase MepM/ murein hydrolase activator NlpD